MVIQMRTRYAKGFVKSVVIIMATCLLGACTSPAYKTFSKEFQAYKALFIEQGRVVDTGNQGVSHSEGQGYGMLFSVVADDEKTFNQLWVWTKQTLQREDKLFHWRYVPCASGDKRCIDDPNNASDGDLLIAWALLRAADEWGNENFRQEAKAIILAMENALLYKLDKQTLLLPGEYGFVDKETSSVQVNLSYWVFPAIESVAKVSSRPGAWRKLRDSGIQLVLEAKFTQHKLPPDWLRITANGLSVNETVNQEYGYNACRIPLHLAWAGIAQPQTYSAFNQWWQQDTTPATLNLVNGEPAEYQMTAGMQAVASAVTHLTYETPLEIDAISRKTDYFSASLILLSRMAVLDAGQ